MKLAHVALAVLGCSLAALACTQAPLTRTDSSTGSPSGSNGAQTAPDFEAVDENGVKFKLSDYRGKVVVLDFWGFW
jgi:cytochrome oxidase Cu insertion factor (SCO1/SenC/PrrC family)